MTKSNCIAPMHRLGAWIFVLVFLHSFPFPHPTLPIKSRLPDSHWESLRIYEPPLSYFPPIYSAFLGGVRQPVPFFIAYELLLAAVATLAAFKYPHWFIGRD